MSRSRRVAPWRDVPRQDGRRFVVTGANGGLGLELTRVLLDRGAEVVMACRNTAKAETARASLGPLGARAEVRELDVASLDSVRAFADGLRDDGGGVDVLVNNAGVLGVPFGLSPDGVELHLATNHLGHFALTNLLLPVLRERVVVVGSTTARIGRIELDDLHWRRRPYRVFAAYGASKLANLLFLAELQRRLTAAGDTRRVTGGHPGATATAITGSTGHGWVTSVGEWGHRLVGMPPERGALPVLYAATMDVPGNSYFGPHLLAEYRGWPVPVGRPQRAADPELARRLWAWSEETSGVGFPDPSRAH